MTARSFRFWIGALIVAIATGVAGGIIVRGPAAPSARPSRAVATRTELFAEIQPVRIANCELHRFGEPYDGGYPLCENLLGSVKSGYSYGISGYDGWGCEVSERLRIRVHQYDCFDLRQPSCPRGQTVFHAECIGTAKETQDGRPFDTLTNQFARNGDASTPIVMKIDVEGAEWDAFLLAPDSTLSQIDQLDVEFHNVDEPKYVEAMRRLKQFFYVVHVHYNNYSCDSSLAPFPSWAFEVLLVSKRLAMSDGSPAPAERRVDSPNNPLAPDCQRARNTAHVGSFIFGRQV
jgi:hypothetical protein